jgi:hypothetical protein
VVGACARVVVCLASSGREDNEGWGGVCFSKYVREESLLLALVTIISSSVAPMLLLRPNSMRFLILFPNSILEVHPSLPFALL